MPKATLTSKDRRRFQHPGENTVPLKAANPDVLSLGGLLKRKGMKPHNADERGIAFKKRVPRK